MMQRTTQIRRSKIRQDRCAGPNSVSTAVAVSSALPRNAAQRRAVKDRGSGTHISAFVWFLLQLVLG